MSENTSKEELQKTASESSHPGRRLRMTVSYDGTDFAGWQLQPVVPTVQGELEKALQRITGGQIRVTGAGRTDAGVHAIGQVAHFDTTGKLAPGEFERALNALLPRSIRVRDLRNAEADFHARFSAAWKIYRYSLAGPQRPEAPLLMRTHWLRKIELDLNLLKRCCQLTLGSHDFFTFSKQEGHRENHVCTIFDAHWTADDGTLYFEVRGDRFLRSMVRMLCGAMLAVADGKTTLAEFSQALEKPGRWKYAVPAPAVGLTMIAVHYESDPGENIRSKKREVTDDA
jgi:tRNA pseudouridine38-40 synthase